MFLAVQTAQEHAQKPDPDRTRGGVDIRAIGLYDWAPTG